jgi:membrane-bound lytic murein transglycosylase B
VVGEALDSAEHLEIVLERDRTQPEFALPLDRYLDRRLDKVTVRTARDRLARHRPLLRRIAGRYGVPPEVVTAVWGLESNFGRFAGVRPTISVLATLGYESRRSEYFRLELFEALRILDRGDIELSKLRGSWAGALGQPQFMPSNYARYAVDFDGDGRIDLHNSSADAIGSVAHYLAEFGWKRGMPTHYAVAAPVDASQRATLLVPDIVPSFSAERMAELGAELDADGRSHEGLLALVELQNGDAAPSYVAGTANFYAITRYNWSSYYAMAVIDVGRAVATAVREQR